MIIVTTKTETHFLNEKNFQEIEYHKDVHQVTAFRNADDKHPQGRRTIPEVLSVRYVTDATPYNDKIEKQPEYDVNLSIKRHNFEAKINGYMQDTIDIIYQVCTSKDVNHKDARENAIKNCESCIEYVRKELEKAKSEGIL